MMRKKIAENKIFCVALSCVVSVMSLSVSTHASDGKNIEYLEIEKIINEIRPMYSSDPMFIFEASEKGYTIEEFLELKAVEKYNRRIEIANDMKKITNGEGKGLGNNGNNLYTYIPLIQQTQTYNCGPTSALQVIYGMGAANNVSGTTDGDKINTLALQADASSSGAIVYKLVNAINLYATANRHYEYIQGNSLTQAQFQSKVETSLFYDLAPILHAKTEWLDYYEGHSSGHYIAVSELDKINGRITVKDCNYNNSYYGTHTEPISNFYDCIQNDLNGARYLICYDY